MSRLSSKPNRPTNCTPRRGAKSTTASAPRVSRSGCCYILAPGRGITDCSIQEAGRADKENRGGEQRVERPPNKYCAHCGRNCGATRNDRLLSAVIAAFIRSPPPFFLPSRAAFDEIGDR